MSIKCHLCKTIISKYNMKIDGTKLINYLKIIKEKNICLICYEKIFINRINNI